MTLNCHLVDQHFLQSGLTPLTKRILTGPAVSTVNIIGSSGAIAACFRHRQENICLTQTKAIKINKSISVVWTLKPLGPSYHGWSDLVHSSYTYSRPHLHSPSTNELRKCINIRYILYIDNSKPPKEFYRKFFYCLRSTASCDKKRQPISCFVLALLLPVGRLFSFVLT